MKKEILKINYNDFGEFVDYIKKGYSLKGVEETLFSKEFINYLTQTILKNILQEKKVCVKGKIYYSLDIKYENYINFYIANSSIELSTEHEDIKNKTAISISRYDELQEALENDIYNYIMKKIVFYYQTNNMQIFINQLGL